MWKTILKTLGHAAVGGAAAAVAPQLPGLIPMIPHIDPFMAAILGSAASSAVSAYFPPPNCETTKVPTKTVGELLKAITKEESKRKVPKKG